MEMNDLSKNTLETFVFAMVRSVDEMSKKFAFVIGGDGNIWNLA